MTDDRAARREPPLHGVPGRWDDEADLLILGYGGAGASCAAVAAETGADVLVLEKGAIGGGNSACIAGSLILHSDDDERALEYLDWLCGGQTEAEVLQAFIDGLAGIPEFQSHLGFPMKEDPKPYRADGFYPEWPGAPGAGGILGHSVITAPGGDALWTAISRLAENRGARVRLETPAERLVQDPDTGEILGAIARTADGRRIAVRGRKATVLATGGFEFNDEMRRQYLSHAPVKFLGSPLLTGDGIAMAQRAGAKLWHMSSVSGPLYWGVEVEAGRVYVTYEFMRAARFGYSSPVFTEAGSLIWVNKNGKRFHNETVEIGTLRHGYANREEWFQIDPDTAEFTHIPAFQIFDEKVFRAGPAMTTLNSRTPLWSADNIAELENGWIIKADTIEELAEKCTFAADPGAYRGGHIDPETLAQTIRDYNAACAAGLDEEFGRKDFLTPLDSGPFYAVGPMVPTFINTHGGPKHDAEQRVLDTNEQPIGRLYAIGECGSMWGPYYNSMGDVTEFMISGANAARSALALEPQG
ncbi:FAD-dependent oxidoreductase [Sinomonas sp. R1AF57]|uniref:FAD-dependent oxidoreductase n=1 Tax=Sinomonas sp. R1AF57 TaxID=2020377 RepID=UPI000B5EEC0D|nr:FAD-dependent oxidoreductase [Sinomonas sp. R1AF57]ASN53370.1 FAD-binding dehydrogenase [Sinomonas sp. R1AF57]